MQAVAVQLSAPAFANRTVTEYEIRDIAYNSGAQTVSVTLAPISSHIDKIRETYTFTRAQVASFYNSYAAPYPGSTTITGSAITNIARDSEEGTYLEISL